MRQKVSRTEGESKKGRVKAHVKRPKQFFKTCMFHTLYACSVTTNTVTLDIIFNLGCHLTVGYHVTLGCHVTLGGHLTVGCHVTLGCHNIL